MAQIQDIAAYLCGRYPHKHELSKTRLTKLVYLADWKSVQKTGHQMSPIKWFFHNFGPYVDDVVESVKGDPRFHIEYTRNFYGDEKMLISLKPRTDYRKNLSSTDVEILDHVIKDTSEMYWNDFLRHVYSTPPIAKTDRYETLDLERFAQNPN